MSVGFVTEFGGHELERHIRGEGTCNDLKWYMHRVANMRAYHVYSGTLPGSMGERDILEVADSVLRGLEVAHSKNIIHGDVK